VLREELQVLELVVLCHLNVAAALFEVGGLPWPRGHPGVEGGGVRVILMRLLHVSLIQADGICKCRLFVGGRCGETTPACVCVHAHVVRGVGLVVAVVHEHEPQVCKRNPLRAIHRIAEVPRMVITTGHPLTPVF
jgi:hypothetical protein